MDSQDCTPPPLSFGPICRTIGIEGDLLGKNGNFTPLYVQRYLDAEIVIHVINESIDPIHPFPDYYFVSRLQDVRYVVADLFDGAVS